MWPENENLLRINYLTPYCRRPSLNDSFDEIQGNVENTITFKTLRIHDIKTKQLLEWSTSIDIIEQYAIYLSTQNEQLDQVMFYNCSRAWFGSKCQYTFDQTTPIESFGDFVVSAFQAREQFNHTFIIQTCYPYLIGCYRGPAPMCLDWREICDGKIDCIGERFGIDEEHCEELEMNECQDDEYRCHNGAQCIPLKFYRDGWLSKDCLDGTDEDEDFTSMNDEPYSQPILLECTGRPTFSCEEKTYRYPRFFSCGDGSYARVFILHNHVKYERSSCRGTGRDISYNQAINKPNKQLSRDCYRLLFCKLRLYHIFTNDVYNQSYCLSTHWLPSNNCSSEWIPFPAEPLFFGYFQLLYSSKSLINNFDGDVAPQYVCNNPRLCLHVTTPVFQMNGLVCRPFQRLDPDEIIEHINFLSADLRDMGYSCLLKGTINRYTANPSLFYCHGSYKYISKHRLIDGTNDCYDGEDEKYADSCSLNNTQRFSCTTEKKCLSPLAIGHSLPNCKGQEDTLTNAYLPSSYPRVCNGIGDVISEDREDEYDCQSWPCHTPYTRCDDVFQCGNGIDELGCSASNCDVNEIKCNMDMFTKHQCIPLAHIYEKPVNCSTVAHGSICRQLFYSSNFTDDQSEFISWKIDTCVTTHHVCDTQSMDDHQLVCSKILPMGASVCHASLVNMYSKDFLCVFSTYQFPPYHQRFFSVWNLGYVPPMKNVPVQRFVDIKTVKTVSANTSVELIEYCNRGLAVFEGKSYDKRCLCPPNYFGDRCQWQSQRVSLTLQLLSIGAIEQETNLVYDVFVYLIDDRYSIVHSYEVIRYIPSFDCQTKFNRFLLYSLKSKHPNETYSIHIDAYDTITLNHHVSWYLSIPFLFLPVNRLTTQLVIPLDRSQPSVHCSLECGIHGKCYDYANANKSFCKCDEGYSGRFCDIRNECSCSYDSICLNSSICLCPLNKFGSKCYLEHQSCQSHRPCGNNGRCIPMSDRIHKKDFICSCDEDSMGSRCEHQSNRIDLHFKTNAIPSVVFAHFITAFQDQKHQRTTKFAKVLFDQQSITLFNKFPFHILLAEFLGSSYVAVLREEFLPSERISVDITMDNICVNVTELLNSSILNLTYLRRLNYYQLPCLRNDKLKCFHDEENTCICDKNRFANCFEFNHTTTYDCRGLNYCENNGKCFQDNATCPKLSVCMCEKCFYGSRCQLTTKEFSLSLDTILGYHVRPFVAFTNQSTTVKITTAVTVLLFVLGLINAFLSILTFRRPALNVTGCGIYLLTISIVSLLTTCVFVIKHCQLIVFQMKLITNPSFIYVICLLSDLFLKCLISFGDWLNACIAIERVCTVVQGTHFNKLKSRSLAKYVTIVVFFSTIASYIHDPISREVFDDRDEQRSWCIVKYSPKIRVFDRFISLFHFWVPFVINVLSASIIIIQMFRNRSKTQIKLSRRTVLYAEIQRHKHILISPCILIVLSLPRLVLSLLSRCMESARDPWLFLAGYYISFVPSLLTFLVYVPPSKTYYDEFLNVFKNIRRALS